MSSAENGRSRGRGLAFGVLVVAASLSCAPDEVIAPARPRVPPSPTGSTGLGSLPRLTRSQYRNAVRDLFGEDVTPLTPLPPDRDPAQAGSMAISLHLAVSALAPSGVADYEDAAYNVAAQAMEPGPARDAIVPCTPATAADALECAEATLVPLARRAFRREIDDVERRTLVQLATLASQTLGDFYDGLEYAIAFILQSPDFLYRQALGEDGVLDGYEIAARMSFFLWDGLPDDVLLAAAADGSLLTDEGLNEQVDRMLADPRAERGLRALVYDWLDLEPLYDLSKDEEIFLAARPELGPAMLEETLRFVVHHVRTRHAPFPDLLVSRETFVDRSLAALYEIPAPAREGFGAITLPADGARRGLLGLGSVLSLSSHPTSSSPTLRGRFVRETLLCQEVPSPPAQLDTMIPPPSGEDRTRRERLASHRDVPSCAICHELLDPIGLGIEQFDGLGHFRRFDEGDIIDATGDLDGVFFADAAGLGEALRDHPELPRCFERRVLTYAIGRVDEDGDIESLRRLDDAFWDSHYDVDALLRAVVLSPAFRTALPEET